MTKEEILNSSWYVRRSAASNPNTPVDTLIELAKDSDYGVRRSAASNPNTPVDTLIELAKDSDYDVRSRAAIDQRKFIIKDNYVATQGTNHLWCKHRGLNIDYYTCGCFIGSRQQLINRIIYDGRYNERMNILNLLDAKFEEVFANNK